LPKRDHLNTDEFLSKNKLKGSVLRYAY
jgi:hypothetical protein